MKNHTDPRVDDYISASAAFAQPILRHLRELFHQACPEVQEEIKWSHPFFILDGKPLANMAAFKAHAAFGFWHHGMRDRLGETGSKSDTAMGNLGRIESLDDLPPAKTLLRLIREAAKLSASDIPAKFKAKPKPMPKIPAAFAERLEKNKTARAAFEKLSPSHQREYIEWITEAKRAETQEKRIVTTLEWVSEGRSRNWKYQDC